MNLSDIFQSVSGLFEVFIPILVVIVGINVTIMIFKMYSSWLDGEPNFEKVHQIETLEPEDTLTRLSSTADDYWQLDDDEIDYTDWHRCRFCNQPINERICPHCKGY